VNRWRRWIVAALAAGLALRLAFALVYWLDQPMTHDEREYVALARSIARGDGFVYPADEPIGGTAQRFGRAPGYPVFLAMLHVTEPVDSVPARVKTAQAVVGTIGVWLIALIAGRVAGARAAVTAAWIAALYPPLVFIPAYALSETLYSTVALAAAWVLERGTLTVPGSERVTVTVSGLRTVTVTLFGGVLIGIGILVRPAMLFFVPAGAIWMVWKRNVRAAVLFVAVALACVAPWTIRNARVYGRFVLVASEGGVTFWTGNNPLARGEGDLAANPELKRAELAFRNRYPALTAEEREPLYYREAFGWIRSHPADWAALLLRKAFFTVVPVGPSYTLHSTKYVLASAGAYLLLLPAALAGAWWLGRDRAPAALWLMAASTLFVSVVFFPQERFRIPVIDPALIVSAAGLAAARSHECTGRRSHV
jgi:4-amino-4-deoxy-L-arabinose transferase-like glycosyltransferase